MVCCHVNITLKLLQLKINIYYVIISVGQKFGSNLSGWLCVRVSHEAAFSCWLVLLSFKRQDLPVIVIVNVGTVLFLIHKNL